MVRRRWFARRLWLVSGTVMLFTQTIRWPPDGRFVFRQGPDPTVPLMVQLRGDQGGGGSSRRTAPRQVDSGSAQRSTSGTESGCLPNGGRSQGSTKATGLWSTIEIRSTRKVSIERWRQWVW